ncbi:molybdenum ABC transporter permease [Galbibacter sp. EGI 63066]|uniref:molybdenum ABC transporter permease n=1 Tax=Galbibacter sp. EGI 63066 TaxID=2993559 RepID=UPI0022489255|nr:molybdenum ABC transporter permease [Galbibacter sp. EGI 63066]MCX2680755.1 molybdenum ABC transporter permease [Galbibacter sp. EGI 63066]
MEAITSQLILGIIALALGVGIIYWINRRKFYRRNVAGLQEFSSFEASVFVRFMERIGKLLAYGLIILGILFLCIYSSEKDRKEPQPEIKTEQPA